MGSLENRIAVVTGASSGIGAALAQALSRAGAGLALLARREDRLQETAAQCPGPTLTLAGDVTDPQVRRSLAEQTRARFGRADILVNNAGQGAYGAFLETTEEQWREMFEVNLFAPMLLTKEFLPLMTARGQGLILNLASIGGLIAHSPKVSAYVSSKHALVGFSRGLARDLEGTGVRVKAICPHLTATEFFNTGPGAGEMSAEADRFREFMDTPEEVAAGIVAKLDDEGLILFPTDKPLRSFEKMRDF